MNSIVITVLILSLFYNTITCAGNACFGFPGPICNATSETFIQCGTACPLNCANYPNPPELCTDNCVCGCFCKTPYIRDTVSNKCVLLQDCSKNNTCLDGTPGPICDPITEVFNSCGKACQPTCDNYNNTKILCIDLCVCGCFCRPPYVRNTVSNRCVLRNECPQMNTCLKRRPVCDEKTEEFNACGTACPLTCDNYQNPPELCDAVCVCNCFCKCPYVRDIKSGKCVYTQNCP